MVFTEESCTLNTDGHEYTITKPLNIQEYVDLMDENGVITSKKLINNAMTLLQGRVQEDGKDVAMGDVKAGIVLEMIESLFQLSHLSKKK